MPVHDWTRVDAEIVHNLHVAWVPAICKALNRVLPDNLYALAEHHASSDIADLLTLDQRPHDRQSLPVPSNAGHLVADVPPRVRWKQSLVRSAVQRRRTVAIRHVSGHRLIAILEIISPANKDRAEHIDDFAAKVVSALDAGVHVLIVDLFPPSRRDPSGLHGIIHQRMEQSDEAYALPPDEPLTLASYVAGPRVDVYLEHVRVGAALPEMPLFIHSDRYINVPLEATYNAAYEGMPGFWKGVVEGRDAVS
jgi:Protein of unknown function (DUF4058)